MAVESELARLQPDEGAGEQSGSHDQGERQGDLQDDTGVPQTCAAIERAAPSLFLQYFVGRNPADRQCRRNAEQQRRRGADRHREAKDTPVERKIEIHRRGGRRQLRDEQAPPPLRQPDAEGGAHQREPQTFGEELAREAPARGAERVPQRELLAAYRGPRDQEVGHIGARDQQHQPDDGEDGGQRLLVARAPDRASAGRRLERERIGQVAVANTLAQRRHRRRADLRLDGSEKRRRLLRRLPRLQPRHDVHPPRRALVKHGRVPANQRLGPERDRDVEGSSDVRTEEPLGRDADDRERRALDRDGLADHVGGAAVAALPHRVADHRHRPVRAAAARVVRLSEGATDHRRHAEHVEHVAARIDACRHVGGGTRRQIERFAGPRERVGREHLSPGLEPLPDRIGPRIIREDDQGTGVAHRQRLQREAVEDREERRHAADAQCQRQDREGGDERRRPQRPPRIAPVHRERSLHRDTSPPLGERKPARLRHRRAPEHRDGARAAGARCLEIARQGEPHALAEPRADVGRIRAQQQGDEPICRLHARPRREAGRRPSSAATSEARRSRSRARICRPLAVTR